MKFDFLSESDQAYFIHKASTLVEALPYIREHSGKNIVIKYGGHAMGETLLSHNFSKDIGLLKEVGINPVVVHGGGPQIGEMLKRKNIKTNFLQGLRVTDKETVKIVEEVLSKDINNKIVNDIKLSGGKAEGFAGNQKNLIEAKQLKISVKDSDSNIEKILDLGFVGTPTWRTSAAPTGANDGANERTGCRAIRRSFGTRCAIFRSRHSYMGRASHRSVSVDAGYAEPHASVVV